MRSSAKVLNTDALKVLTFREWCSLNSFSKATGKRIMQSGDGPKVIQLSAKRVGIRMIDNAEWQEARLRT